MRTSSNRNLLVGSLLAFAAAIAVVEMNPASQQSALAQNATSSNAMQNKATTKKPVIHFTEDGKLLQPTGYRKWMHVGTPLTPNDMNAGKAAFPEFHSVYINSKAYDHYEKTGQFPNGTALIKELVSVGSKSASSGNGYFMGEFTGLEVLLKDKVRFRNEPGNWGFFSFGHKYPLKAAATIQPAANCNDCHGGEADDDYVFTQYYPVLRAAKANRDAK